MAKLITEAEIHEAICHCDRCERMYDAITESWEKREKWRSYGCNTDRKTVHYRIYDAIRDANPAITKTYPYVSHQLNCAANLIGYTPNPEYGAADRQVISTIDKYLIKMGIADEERNRIASAWRAEYGIRKLSILINPDEIVEAYLDGPTSCMAYPASDYSTGGTHPTSVYGGNTDTGLAVLRDTGGHVTARVIVRISTKQYGRIYGDTSLADKLQAEGWTAGSLSGDNHYLIGASLIRRDTGDNIVCPYIDGTIYITKHSDKLELSQYGDYDGKRTDGILIADGDCEDGDGDYCICPSCNETMYDDNSYSLGDMTVCEGCYEDCSECRDCDSVERNDRMYSVGDNMVCGDCWENYSECSDCETVNLSDDLDSNGRCQTCATVVAERMKDSKRLT